MSTIIFIILRLQVIESVLLLAFLIIYVKNNYFKLEWKLL